MSSSKQYGLQIPKKGLHGMVAKHAAFGDDSESDKSDGGGTDWTKRALKTSEKTSVKRQTKIDMERALEQDSSVYQYDEVYDQIEKNKLDKNQREKDKKPKYVQKLLANAEKRKIENERRVERQVQKERELEGEEFKDKETFVTSAYKKKLEEFAKLDAEHRRQDMLEELGDVTKQQDMSGFYRHLYQSTVSGPQEEAQSKSKSENPKVSNKNSEKSDAKKDSRQYRKRKTSESDGDKENKDADTDIDSSSESSSSGSDSESGEVKSSHSESEDPKRMRSKEPSSVDPPAADPEKAPVTEKVQEQPPEEPERSIWEKRTVGPVFEAALKRYFERKSARLVPAS